MKATFTVVLFALQLVLLQREAGAEMVAQLQLDGHAFFDEYARAETAWETDGGVGLTGLLGYRLETSAVVLTPELGVSYSWFNDDYERAAFRVFGGGRVAMPWKVEPSIYLHLGWGRASGVDYDAVLERNGLTLGAGVAADYAIISWWSIGAQLGYTFFSAETGSGRDNDHWISLGAHTGFRF